MRNFGDALSAAGVRPLDDASQSEKKNYAQYLSEATALLVANELRGFFPEILPRADGTGQESRARTGKGIKKLDVNYSTPELGLGLGISIKTLNYRDPKTRRYTKNPTRLDNELRAEAADYHERQPYAFLVGLVLVPADGTRDGDPGKPRVSRSSFAQIVNVLRHRAGRKSPRDDKESFERVFIGLYEHAGSALGELRFFNAVQRPPQFGYPEDGVIDLPAMLTEVVDAYDERNGVRHAWEDSGSRVPAPFEELRNEPVDEDDGEE